ncbi:MAG: hypothetical protein ABI550_06575 [Ignavibacteriaceae bacterium]
MAEHELKKFQIVNWKQKNKIVEVLSRSDILKARKKRIEEERRYQKSLKFPPKEKQPKA